MVAAAGLLALTAGSATASTRSLKLYNLHTHEKAEIVYKRNGRYDAAGLKKVNHILRDWRRNEPIKMDPRLLDLVWEAYRASGSSEYIQVICGYRAPATNSMLRSRSKGVAQQSQHMLGKALDYYIPGVPLKKLRDIGLKMQGGGVGYYPTSGSPFVHMDVGNVRHWPGISRQELVRVFPDGKTLHVPSDGKPLPGYEQALASYKSRKSSGSTAIALASTGGSSKSGGLLAALFGGGADEEEDVADVATAPAPKARVAKAEPAARSLPGITIVAPENAQRAELSQVAEAAPEEVDVPSQTPEKIIAALPARSIPLPGFAPRPKLDVGVQVAEAASPATPEPEIVPFAVASAEPANVPATISTADAPQIASSTIPLPSWRPALTTPHELAPEKKNAVLLALADTGVTGNAASDALAVLPSARPETVGTPVNAKLAEAKQAEVTRDEIRAVLERAAAETPQLASFSPPPRSAFSDPFGVDAASPRVAVATRPSGSDPVAAIGAGVKTTRKEARASTRDLKPEAKAIVVSAEPKAARWALRSADYVETVDDSTTAPRFAYNFVRTAPSEVYTNGFQSENEMANANRFTGTAVKFMTVARFQTK